MLSSDGLLLRHVAGAGKSGKDRYRWRPSPHHLVCGSALRGSTQRGLTQRSKLAPKILQAEQASFCEPSIGETYAAGDGLGHVPVSVATPCMRHRLTPMSNRPDDGCVYLATIVARSVLPGPSSGSDSSLGVGMTKRVQVPLVGLIWNERDVKSRTSLDRLWVQVEKMLTTGSSRLHPMAQPGHCSLGNKLGGRSSFLVN